MFGRDNIIGVLLLGFCTVVAGIMVYYIAIGERPDLNWPTWANVGIGVLFIGLLIFGAVQGGMFRRNRTRGAQWPDPGTGRKSWWDRLRGR